MIQAKDIKLDRSISTKAHMSSNPVSRKKQLTYGCKAGSSK